jgi:hypothetical protein
MTRQPPAVHFQAEHSNDSWHFDLSPSDLKHLKQPSWVEPGRAIHYSYFTVLSMIEVVFVTFKYHYVYGEDVEAALHFLFNAMTAKTTEGFPFQGIPEMIYTKSGYQNPLILKQQ